MTCEVCTRSSAARRRLRRLVTIASWRILDFCLGWSARYRKARGGLWRYVEYSDWWESFGPRWERGMLRNHWTPHVHAVDDHRVRPLAELAHVPAQICEGIRADDLS